MEKLDGINIVLVEPQDGANIGSVCRAMKTMGLSSLSIVGKRENYDDNRVRTLALHAADLWENATFFSSLKDALKDSVFTSGATRRRGKFRKMSFFSPEQLVEKVFSYPYGSKVSIVFGRESDGLKDSEVNECSSIVTIPTSDDFPSLNLSQAVQIISYEIFTSSLKYREGLVPVNKERIDNSVTLISSKLSSLGYYKWDEEEKWTKQLLRDIIERASLSESELRRFEKIFKKSETITKYKGDKQ